MKWSSGQNVTILRGPWDVGRGLAERIAAGQPNSAALRQSQFHESLFSIH